MHHVILPFSLSKDRHTKAVSEHTFTIDSPRGQFRGINIASLRFMKVYEQERYTITQYPFTGAWDEHKANLDLQRSTQAFGPARNDLDWGTGRSPDLKNLDELPHMIELEVVRLPHRRVRTHTTFPLSEEYNTQFAPSKPIESDSTKIQRMLVYSTNLTVGRHFGYAGTISCNMSNLGMVDISGMGQANEFTIRASVYNFMRQPIGEFPEMELGLVFL